jgi:protein-tyrosine phosphatase
MHDAKRLLDFPSLLNARDLGGYPTVDGSKTRWRSLLRSDDLAQLTLAGLRASAIALIPARNAAPLFLSPDARVPAAAAPTASRLLAAAVMLLALVGAFSWPVAQQFRLAALEREIAALKPAADAALHARQEHRRDADQAAEIARLRTGRPPLIAIIEALSRELPDGSWLTSLSIAGRDVMLEGLTPSAATIAL